MPATACCCCSSKDAAITIGIWSLVYSMASLLLFGWQTGVLNHCRAVTMAQSNLQCEWDCPCVGASTKRTASIIEEKWAWFKVSSIAQLGIMGWQMAAIKYERDRAANTLLPNYNTYGRFDIPSYYESYWQSPEERYYTGLFVIQVLCLIAAFFLLFASAAMIYGIHTWSKYLVWPWFPVMISSILATLAYCIMWWAGDVRDYWLAITIIEIIVVFVNIYCVVVVMVYYRRINATTDEYEGKDRRGVRYKINRHGQSRRDLLDSYDGIDRSLSPKQLPYKPLAQPYPVYPSYSRAGVPQTPIPLPATQINTPYPIDPNEIRYEREMKPKSVMDDRDPVGSWVREQQTIDRNSEPVGAVSKQVHPTTLNTLQHSRSVPSLYDGTLVSHKDCDHSRSHHHRRSSSMRRRRRDCSSDSDSDFTRRHRHRSSSRRRSSRHRRSSRSRYDESVTNCGESDGERDRRCSRRHRHGSSRRHRDERSRHDNSEVVSVPKDVPRDAPQHAPETESGMRFPLSGGISIPQHIVIPPSTGERGPDGKPVPQKFHINSEITINYDQNGRPVQQVQPPRSTMQYADEPYRRRHPIQIQSTF